MILVVNLNLAIDCVVYVEQLRPGEVHRSRLTRRQAGGKGVNVARVLKALGEPAAVSGFLGGRAGEFIRAGLDAEGISHLCTPIGGESRTCLILCDDADRQTVINEPGPAITREEMSQFTADYERHLGRAEMVVITGSLPPGLPEEAYADLIRTATAAGRRVLLDSSGAALHRAVAARPFLVKINGDEAGELLGHPVREPEEAAAAIDALIASGAAHAMITLGARGALLAYGGARYGLTPPRVPSRNSVGSGDACLAGLAAALRRGEDAAAAGVLAMAAGAANALHGMGHCTAQEIAALRAQVVCRAV